MALTLKIKKKWNELQSNYFWDLPPISECTEFISSCSIVYLMIQEFFLAPVFSISMLGGHIWRSSGKNDAFWEVEILESSMTKMAHWRDLGRKFRINYKKLQNLSLMSTTCEKLWFPFTLFRNTTYLLLCPAFALNTQMLYITQENEHLPVSSIVPSTYINTQQIMSLVLY